MHKDDLETLKAYLKQIESLPKLSHDEETALVLQGQKGDQDAKNRIIEANLRYVIKVALEYSNAAMPLQDLINEGNLGLIHAFDRFDLSKGYRFISYAIWWVKQSILNALHVSGNLIRLPDNKMKSMSKIREIEKKQQNEESIETNVEQFAQELGIEPFLLNRLFNVSAIGSVDAPTSISAENKTSLVDMLEDEQNISPENSLKKTELDESIKFALAQLSEIESQVIVTRFGLFNNAKMTLKELGKQLSLSNERIRQIEKKALGKLSEGENTLFDFWDEKEL